MAIASAVALALLVLVRLAVGVEKALHFDGPAVDGPFQLFNALRRIAAGQRAGVDFQFFHGIAVPFLHYPLFRLFGGDLFASELSRQLITILAAPVVSLVFFWYFTKDLAKTLGLTTLVYLAELAFPLGSVVQPAVSMLGLRSTMPVLVSVAMVASASRRRRMVAVGITLGLALVFGTEQGLAAVVAFIVISAVLAWRSTQARERIIEGAATVALAVATLIAVSFLLGGWHGMAGSLRYNLVLVPRDQYWYFGAPASYFLPDWRSLPHMLRQMPGIPIAVIGAVFAIVVELRQGQRGGNAIVVRDAHALAFLAAYGLVACASVMGIFHDVYAEPCLRVLMLIGALEVGRWMESRTVSRERAARDCAALAVALTVVMILRTPSVIGATLSTLPHVVREHVFGGERGRPEGIWPDALNLGNEVVRRERNANGRPSLWSTYSGWLEASNGTFNPTPFDYMMHALGPANRERYLDIFRSVRPSVVQTVSPTYASAELWMAQTSWDFYDELLRHYRAVGASPWSIFWVRRTDSLPSPTVAWSGTVAPNAIAIELPVASAVDDSTPYTLLEVQLDYDTRSLLQRVPVIGAWPRYFVEIENAASRFPVTLDPWTTSQRFPVVAVRGRNPVLRFHLYSLVPGARLEIRKVGVSRLPVGDNARWFDLIVATELTRNKPGPGGDTTGIYRWR